MIGLSGGVASGKSTVAEILASLDAAVIDADQLNDRVLAEPQVIDAIRRMWGDVMIAQDGQVDRSRLADVVFRDPAQRQRLEALTHPRIAVMSASLLEGYQADPKVRAVVYNAPLLFEAGLNEFCDCVLFVDVDEQTRADRVARTRGWTQEDLKRRENAQLPLDNKRQKSDYIVKNNSSLEMLRLRVEEIFSEILSVYSNA